MTDSESRCCIQTYCFCRSTSAGDTLANYQCTLGPSALSSTPSPTLPVTNPGGAVCERTTHDHIATVLYQIGAEGCIPDGDCESGCCLQEYCMCHGTFTGDNPDHCQCTDGRHPSIPMPDCYEDADCEMVIKLYQIAMYIINTVISNRICVKYPTDQQANIPLLRERYLRLGHRKT